VARMALLLAGIPPSVPAETLNRLCASFITTSILSFYITSEKIKAHKFC